MTATSLDIHIISFSLSSQNFIVGGEGLEKSNINGLAAVLAQWRKKENKEGFTNLIHYINL